MGCDIDVLNDEILAAGVRVFVGGLCPTGSAKSLRVQTNCEVRITDGPYLDATTRWRFLEAESRLARR